MVRTRTASRSRRAPARARAVPAGRPRIRRQSVVSHSSVGRFARSPPRRVAGPSGTGFGRARARSGADGARSGADRAGLARMATGRCARARFARLDAGSSSVVGGSGCWLGVWFGWVGPPALPGRAAAAKPARARASAKKIFMSHHFAFARAPTRPRARARARAFFPRCCFPFSRASDATEAWASIPKPNQIELTHHAKPQKPNANGTESLSAELARPDFSRHRLLRSAAHARIHPRKRKKNSLPKAFCDVSGMRWCKQTPKKAPLLFWLCLRLDRNALHSGPKRRKGLGAQKKKEQVSGRAELPHVPVARAEGPRPRSAARPPALKYLYF